MRRRLRHLLFAACLVPPAAAPASAQLAPWNFRAPPKGTWIFYRPFTLVTGGDFHIREPGTRKTLYAVWGPAKIELPPDRVAGPAPADLVARARTIARQRGWDCQPSVKVSPYDARGSARDRAELVPLALRLSGHSAAGVSDIDRKCIAKLFNQAGLSLENSPRVAGRPFAEARPAIMQALRLYRAGRRYQVTNGLLANHALLLVRLGHPQKALASFQNLPPIRLSFLTVFAGRMAIRLALLQAYVPAVLDRANRKRHLADAARYTIRYDRAANGWRQRARVRAARRFWQRIFAHLVVMARTSGAAKEAAVFQGALTALTGR
jgi:hypothetical protein